MPTSDAMKRAKRLARRKLGISKPYKHQKRAWKAAIDENRSVFSVMPTGSGKSASFQVPCMVRKGLSIVVSPLLALMREQVERLQNAGVRAFRIGMDMKKSEIRETMRAIKSKKAKIVYVAPERLQKADFLSALEMRVVKTLVVDECHCMSIWSRDFRPAYKSVGLFRQRFYKAIVIAVTATADEYVERDVVETLKMYDYERIVGEPNRPNLEYEAVYDAESHYITTVFDTSKRMGGDGCGIVYCASRRHVEEIFKKLRYGSKLAVAYYHAGLDAYQRQAIQDEFMDDQYDIMVATNAFGMGVDKGDVRMVYHFDFPESVFAYAQEAGRAGRDGKPALCILNIGKKGKQIRNFLFQINNPKYYVYERLWRNFNKHKRREPFVLTSDQLDRIGGSSLNGTGVSAMRYMEYKHAIRTGPGQNKYVLPIIRKDAAIEVCHECNVDYEISHDGDLVIFLPADYNGSVLQRLKRRHATIMRRPVESFVIERLTVDSRITPDDVDLKRERAEDKLNEVYRFAEAFDKHEFLNEAFLK